jgi:hypothetical protein
MTPTALHLLTAERIRSADAVLKQKIADAQIIVCDASIIRQTEFDTLRAMAPHATLLASINAHALYAQGPINPFYDEFRSRMDSGHYFYDHCPFGPDATTDKALGPEFFPSLRTAEALAASCNTLFAFQGRRWDGIYLDDAWMQYPPRYRAISDIYGFFHREGWRSYVQHFIRCTSRFGWIVWANTASADGYAGARNCCEAGSGVPWSSLVRHAVGQCIAWGYDFPGVDGLLLAGEVLT